MPIYQQIIDELLDTDEFKKLIDELAAKNKSFSDAKPDDFIDVTESINGKVRQATLEKPSLKDLVREDLKAQTVHDCFFEKEQRDNTNGHRVSTIHSLLVFLGKNKDEWDDYKKVLPDYSPYSINEKKLIGFWYLFRLDIDGKVKRTTLQIHRWVGKKLQATYRSLHDTTYRNGKVEQVGKLLIILLKSKDQVIEFRTQIDDRILEESRFMNALAISSIEGNAPMARPLVMVHIDELKEIEDERKKIIASIDNEKLCIVLHSSQNISKQSTNSSELNKTTQIRTDLTKEKHSIIHNKKWYDPIVEFLHNTSHTLFAYPFNPSSLKGIRSWNEEIYRKRNNGYNKLKEIITDTEIWVGLSRIETQNRQIGIFRFKFYFDDIKKICQVKRWRNGQEKSVFKGRVRWNNNKFIFEFIDKEKSRIKRFVGRLVLSNNVKEANRIIGLSLTETNSGQEMTTRELIIRTTKEEPIKASKGCISYEEFRNLNCIPDEEKLLFISRQESTLINPYYLFDSHSDRRSDARLQAVDKYYGNYFAYVIDSYHPGALLRVTIEIDKLGQTIEKFTLTPYQENQKGICETIQTSYGHARIARETLRISNHDDKLVPRSVYIFEIRPRDFGEKEILLEGLVLDTDKKGRPIVSRCIMIRDTELASLSMRFLPDILNADTPEYDQVNKILMENEDIRSSIEDYFFQPFTQHLRFPKY